MKKISLIFVLSILLAACIAPNSVPNTTPKQTKSRTQVVNDLMSTAHQEHAQKFGGIYSDVGKTKHIQSIMNRLRKTSGFNGKTINAIILNSGDVNAYSLKSEAKNAYVYITRDMLNFVKNDDELAFVLAHEMAHISINNHHKKTPKQNIAEELKADKLAKRYIIRRPIYDFIRRLAARQKYLTNADAHYYPSNAQRLSQLYTPHSKTRKS
ncbi:MAG: M48 family metalloprotease [Rhizobiales bacterium]|nr:M48 family metalloprotease [Hyphomicrobiales bacterium]